jgi:hypothetical protein
VPLGMIVRTFLVESSAMRAATSAGLLRPPFARRYAERPATWGLERERGINNPPYSTSSQRRNIITHVAIEVPDILCVAFGAPIQVLIMLAPGANTSTTLPKLEFGDLALEIVEAPTVIASATRAGLVVLALMLPTRTTGLNTPFGRQAEVKVWWRRWWLTHCCQQRP